MADQLSLEEKHNARLAALEILLIAVVCERPFLPPRHRQEALVRAEKASRRLTFLRFPASVGVDVTRLQAYRTCVIEQATNFLLTSTKGTGAPAAS